MAFTKALLVGGVVITGSIALPSRASAANLSLDWAQVAQSGSWPNGLQSGNFAVGEGTIDVSFEQGSGVSFVGFGGSTITPAINSVLNGADADTNPSLQSCKQSPRLASVGCSAVRL